MIEFKKPSNGGDIIGFMKFPHPGDHFLYQVLVEVPESGEYVVWMYNSQSRGYSHGHYFTEPGQAEKNRDAAFECFAQKVKDRVDAFVKSR